MEEMERAEKKHVGEKVREIIGEKVKANAQSVHWLMRYIKDLTLYKEAAERIENICLTLRYTGAAKFFAQYRKVCYTSMETVFILRENFRKLSCNNWLRISA